ncbi:MAG TPA: hypothetical protein VGA01_16825 [Candidatus Binatia bacterium]
MKTLRKVLLVVGKVLLAIGLGVVAMFVVAMVLGAGFGFLHGLFGWSVPTFATQELIALAIFVIGLLIYREKAGLQRAAKTTAMNPTPQRVNNRQKDSSAQK